MHTYKHTCTCVFICVYVYNSCVCMRTCTHIHIHTYRNTCSICPMCLCWTVNTVHSLELLKSPVWLSSILRHPMYPSCMCHLDSLFTILYEYIKLLRSCYISLRMHDLRISMFSIRKQVSLVLHYFCFVLSHLFSTYHQLLSNHWSFFKDLCNYEM